MQVNDRMKVKIESIAFGGDGVGRVNHFVVFVPFAAEGDELEIVITQVKKRFLRGRIFRIITHSPWRVRPLCPYYGECGGCCYQHLDYPYQLAVKKKQVEDVFSKIGKIAHPPVLEVVASPRVYHYRGKAQVHVEAASEDLRLGFLDVSGANLMDIETCAIMDESINEQLRLLRERKPSRGLEKMRSTVWSAHDAQQTHRGRAVIRMVKNRKFFVPPEGFFQANLYLTDRLVDEVCRMVAAEKAGTLVDAYCGCGLFSVFLSPWARKIIGIELDEQSVDFARKNAEESGVVNAEFLCGDVMSVLENNFLRVGRKMDVLILDPPRAGCPRTVLEMIGRLKPRRIVYISCNPATQARDARFLLGGGYVLKNLLPLDMFPQTQHIEVIGLLELAA